MPKPKQTRPKPKKVQTIAKPAKTTRQAKPGKKRVAIKPTKNAVSTNKLVFALKHKVNILNFEVRALVLVVAVLLALIGVSFVAAGQLSPDKGYGRKECTAANGYKNITAPANSGIPGYNANGSPSEQSCIDQSAEAWIARMYLVLLNRKPDSAGYRYWSDRYVSVDNPREAIVGPFVSTAEVKAAFTDKTSLDQVKIMYERGLGRSADGDPGGRDYWKARFDDKSKLANNIISFLNSNEGLGHMQAPVKDAFSTLPAEYTPTPKPEYQAPPTTTAPKTPAPTNTTPDKSIGGNTATGTNGGSVVAPKPAVVGAGEVLISGVVKQDARPLAGVGVFNCYNNGTRATTDASGSYSMSVKVGSGFCVRLESGYDASLKVRASNVTAEFVNGASYEYQIAGKSCYHNFQFCGANRDGNDDNFVFNDKDNGDGGYDFAIYKSLAPVDSPSVVPEIKCPNGKVAKPSPGVSNVGATAHNIRLTCGFEVEPPPPVVNTPTKKSRPAASGDNRTRSGKRSGGTSKTKKSSGTRATGGVPPRSDAGYNGVYLDESGAGSSSPKDDAIYPCTVSYTHDVMFYGTAAQCLAAGGSY